MNNLHKIGSEEIPAAYRAFVHMWLGKAEYEWRRNHKVLWCISSGAKVTTDWMIEEAETHYKMRGYYPLYKGNNKLPPNLKIV